MFKKKSPHVGACMALHVVVSVLLFVAAVAAILGVYKAHVLSTGLAFGTTSGSLALVALAIVLHTWMKQTIACVTKCEACGIK
ncbi:hypothetical protein HYZ99_01615 [Candidatus Peregrinibacteria bacterium]|nr:hypothetical protein [Candidatus Peregrinibacteria bacterium]